MNSKPLFVEGEICGQLFLRKENISTKGVKSMHVRVCVLFTCLPVTNKHHFVRGDSPLVKIQLMSIAGVKYAIVVNLR